MDFKKRFKNPIFWINVVLSIGTPVLAYYGMRASDFTTWVSVTDTISKALDNPYVLLSIVIALWTTVIDPTTKGISDKK